MARSTIIPSVLAYTVIVAAFTVGGVFAVNSMMAGAVGYETSCKITQLEPVKDSPNELLIHTDGCSNSAVKEHVFRADRNELAASFTDPNFTVNNFYEGVAAGKTYNFDLEGMSAGPFGTMPKIVKVAKDSMPY